MLARSFDRRTTGVCMSNEVRAPAPGVDTGAADPLVHRWPGEQQMVWTVWLTYGAFYFCRTNLSAAVDGMGKSPGEGGLGLTGDEIANILASLKITYGIGQLFNGQFSERVSPRTMLAIGMFVSALLNVVFGLGSGYFFLLFVWATNGYVQSLGWTPCVRVVGNWIPVLRRGLAIGLIGTGYQITASLTYLVSTQAAEHFGWRGALFAPSILLAASAGVMLLFLRESPRDHHTEKQSAAPQAPRVERPALGEVLRLTFSNRALWLLGASLALLNACRYGFVDWGIKHLIDVQDIGVGKAGLQYVVLPLGGVPGAYITGWVTDRFFGGRRVPVIVGLLVLLGLLTFAYESVSRTSGTATVGLLVVIGFCVYGPQVLLVGTAPADLARKGTAAAAAGFVNFLGYMGAAAGDKVTGYLQAPEHGGWQLAIYVWAAWAFVAAGFAACLWNRTANRDHGSH
jgi:sugar phosphate permease